MNVASLDNCKRLYELSGWDTGQSWNIILGLKPKTYVPGYHAGYLLRKLTEVKTGLTVYHVHSTMCYEAFYAGKFFEYGTNTQHWDTQSDTPEDALCLLAIKLFEEGILTNENR